MQALREHIQRTDENTAPASARPPVRSINASVLPSTQQSIVFVAAEATPYSKTGGLGDVVGSLTIALAQRGHRVMVVVPRYQTCARDRFLLRGLHDCSTWLRLDLGNGEHWVNYHHESRKGVDWVFVEHVSFERDGGLYGNSHGIYADNLFRYAPPRHSSIPQSRAVNSTSYMVVNWVATVYKTAQFPPTGL